MPKHPEYFERGHLVSKIPVFLRRLGQGLYGKVSRIRGSSLSSSVEAENLFNTATRNESDFRAQLIQECITTTSVSDETIFKYITANLRREIASFAVMPEIYDSKRVSSGRKCYQQAMQDAQQNRVHPQHLKVLERNITSVQGMLILLEHGRRDRSGDFDTGNDIIDALGRNAQKKIPALADQSAAFKYCLGKFQIKTDKMF